MSFSVSHIFRRLGTSAEPPALACLRVHTVTPTSQSVLHTRVHTHKDKHNPSCCSVILDDGEVFRFVHKVRGKIWAPVKQKAPIGFRRKCRAVWNPLEKASQPLGCLFESVRF